MSERPRLDHNQIVNFGVWCNNRKFSMRGGYKKRGIK